mgnify:CR=1 FL=1|tara:strand:+ start:102 stop:1082 length:981 start_codon:yes stop_codon:yes gene_type:complete
MQVDGIGQTQINFSRGSGFCAATSLKQQETQEIAKQLAGSVTDRMFEDLFDNLQGIKSFHQPEIKEDLQERLPIEEARVEDLVRDKTFEKKINSELININLVSGKQIFSLSKDFELKDLARKIEFELGVPSFCQNLLSESDSNLTLVLSISEDEFQDIGAKAALIHDFLNFSFLDTDMSKNAKNVISDFISEIQDIDQVVRQMQEDGALIDVESLKTLFDVTRGCEEVFLIMVQRRLLSPQEIVNGIRDIYKEEGGYNEGKLDSFLSKLDYPRGSFEVYSKTLESLRDFGNAEDRALLTDDRLQDCYGRPQGNHYGFFFAEMRGAR